MLVIILTRCDCEITKGWRVSRNKYEATEDGSDGV